jgi:hypothetical protein
MKHTLGSAAWRAIAVAAAVAALASPAFAIDPRHPDWPCHQIKVPELSLAAVWAGAPLDDVGNAWENDPQVRGLAERLAARRTPIDEAEKAIADFVAGDTASRQHKGRLLMAGLFTLLNAERTQVMNGIERFARRQKGFADKIRKETADIRALQDTPDHDPKKLDQLVEVINWDTRIFEDQRRTIGYVCEVPTAIERRLFALARAIQQAME